MTMIYNNETITCYNLYDVKTGKTVESFALSQYTEMVDKWLPELLSGTHNFFVAESPFEDYPETLTFEV